MGSGIESYSEFVSLLKLTLDRFQAEPREKWMEKAASCVDGMASTELRRLVPLEERRSRGAFFTSTTLAEKVVELMIPSLNSDSIIYDSACGAGNLLLSIWDALVKADIKPRNKQFLLGSDIGSEFVDASINRLAIKKLMLSEKINRTHQLGECFSIKQFDGLLDNEFYQKATHIFVNPPFNLISVDSSTNWSKGKASAAALFIDRIIKYVRPGTSITCILPEVLRSGSRYHSWRGMVLNSCIVESIKLLGQFDKHTDIDVFAITLKKRKRSVKAKTSINKLQPVKTFEKTIHDCFNVCVGPVVDNRDEHVGIRRGYIVSRGLEGWMVKTKFSQSRQHTGKSFQGPFVVIKRTSRMGEGKRAIATIIDTPKPVYIDNHLIILVPKSGGMKECKKAISILKDQRTDDWLNKEIRCRHLTVKIVSMIPLWQ